MIIWSFVEVTYLPDSLLSLVHQVHLRSVLVPKDYGVTYAVASTTALIIRVIGTSVAALWFWNCGPGAQSAFSPRRQNDPPA
jgi:hypothetical protein